MTRMARISRSRAAIAAIALLMATGIAESRDERRRDGGNPMWAAGYSWHCESVARLVCERDNTCSQADGGRNGFDIDYRKSTVDFSGEFVRFKRHYDQTVQASPLQAEVKIELVDNRVIWLTPVDISLVFSTIWTGVLLEPKGGVVLSVLDTVYCQPN